MRWGVEVEGRGQKGVGWMGGEWRLLAQRGAETVELNLFCMSHMHGSVALTLFSSPPFGPGRAAEGCGEGGGVCGGRGLSWLKEGLKQLN